MWLSETVHQLPIRCGSPLITVWMRQYLNHLVISEVVHQLLSDWMRQSFNHCVSGAVPQSLGDWVRQSIKYSIIECGSPLITVWVRQSLNHSVSSVIYPGWPGMFSNKLLVLFCNTWVMSPHCWDVSRIQRINLTGWSEEERMIPT